MGEYRGNEIIVRYDEHTCTHSGNCVKTLPAVFNVNAKPWVNANGMMVANNNAELHTRKGDAAVFVDERGQRIPGQWPGSPSPVEHDILTGSTPEGTVLAGMTCNDWTSDSSTVAAQVGHTDGLGPNANPAGNFASWNSSHANASCADTAPRGGAGRLYCFAAK